MMMSEDPKLVAKIQHFYEYMQIRKSEIEESLIKKSPDCIRELNLAYEDLAEEYVVLFKEIIYQI